jgi:uncharacterized protein YdeI (YjbR/CyaY-like superfamily)
MTPKSAPTFFATPAGFRAWLVKHHESVPELLVGFYKRDTGKPSITWPESVDQALCFGWIDGVRRRIDEARYSIRFTPRRTGSIWSAVNIRRVEELKAMGLMQPAGLAAFERRIESKSRVYAYEQRDEIVLDPAHQALLEADRKAWAFFESQPPSYRKLALYWVASAKKEETRLRRLGALVKACAERRRVY